MTIRYDPSQHFDLEIQDLPYRNDPARTLLARIYQPKGRGPFPTLLDVHGGAWNRGDRLSNASVDEHLAASGILVVAIDLRLAHEASYPASINDANYGVRWLKAHAAEWNGDTTKVGAILQGGEDTNVPPPLQKHFADSHEKAGGHVTLEVFAGCEHRWVRTPGPDADRSHSNGQRFYCRTDRLRQNFGLRDFEFRIFHKLLPNT